MACSTRPTRTACSPGGVPVDSASMRPSASRARTEPASNGCSVTVLVPPSLWNGSTPQAASSPSRRLSQSSSIGCPPEVGYPARPTNPTRRAPTEGGSGRPARSNLRGVAAALPRVWRSHKAPASVSQPPHDPQAFRCRKRGWNRYPCTRPSKAVRQFHVWGSIPIPTAAGDSEWRAVSAFPKSEASASARGALASFPRIPGMSACAKNR